MIDTKELRRVAVDCSWPTSPVPIGDILDRLEAAEKERDDLRKSEKWYRRRCDLLQEQQSKMRDPERTIVCDILANGALLHADFAGDRYALPGAQNVPSVPDGWIQRGIAELEAIRNRHDDDTLLNDRTLIERIGKAMLAAAPEAKQ